MGRNGKKNNVFGQMVRIMARHTEGDPLTPEELLDGNGPDRGAGTSYLYKLVKLGYLRQARGKSPMDPEAVYILRRTLPRGYTSERMKQELKILNRKDND